MHHPKSGQDMNIRRGSYVIYGFYICPMGSTELAALPRFTHIVIHHSIMRTHLFLPRHTPFWTWTLTKKPQFQVLLEAVPYA